MLILSNDRNNKTLLTLRETTMIKQNLKEQLAEKADHHTQGPQCRCMPPFASCKYMREQLLGPWGYQLSRLALIFDSILLFGLRLTQRQTLSFSGILKPSHKNKYGTCLPENSISYSGFCLLSTTWHGGCRAGNTLIT